MADTTSQHSTHPNRYRRVLEEAKFDGSQKEEVSAFTIVDLKPEAVNSFSAFPIRRDPSAALGDGYYFEVGSPTTSAIREAVETRHGGFEIVRVAIWTQNWLELSDASNLHSLIIRTGSDILRELSSQLYDLAPGGLPRLVINRLIRRYKEAKGIEIDAVLGSVDGDILRPCSASVDQRVWIAAKNLDTIHIQDRMQVVAR